MPLSWNEIKDRALAFSKEWADTHNEEADAKPFLEAFFNVFGITRKKIATFEHKVKKLDTHDGYIDLFWKGTFLVEMKSKGKNLDKAYTQAREYLQTVPIHELPQYILICDFDTFRLYDYEKGISHQFLLKDLVNNVQHFGFIAGYIKREFKEQDPVNIKAAALMGKLHDRLKEIGYTGHPLEVYLVRLLFCLFAEDTTIFNKASFYEFITTRTAQDGSDLAARLHELFQVLNTPEDKRLKFLDESLKLFPYVNGRLFEEILPTAAFDSQMRQTLLECCTLDWGTISPAIFGSMFQSVMDEKERRNLGAHYTSEKNILKLIKPLFLDELWQEFESVKNNRHKLADFHKKLSRLKFLDPACGCGNFLVITYRELRLLEIEILRAMNKTGQGFLDVREIIWLDVDMMHGIEYEEFPAQIAQVAMWLIDHQMNMLISAEFGQYFVRLPLKKAAKIVHGNALQINWQDLLNHVNTIDVYAEHANIYLAEDPGAEYKTVNVQAKTYQIHKGEKPESNEEAKFDFIFGNPPFIGRPFRNEAQRIDHDRLTKDISQGGDLDYVANWFIISANYIKSSKAEFGFVATNSICQGVQISLWSKLILVDKLKIKFAYQTFVWNNEARGNAAVHCVIIGISNKNYPAKKLYHYDAKTQQPFEEIVKNISPYLISGGDTIVLARSEPLCKVKPMVLGSQPTDDGNFMFTEEQMHEFIKAEPASEKLFRRVMGSVEFINNIKRYCLWLVNANPSELIKMPLVLDRINKVRKFRLESTKQATRTSAESPSIFQMIRHNDQDYLLIPRVSSENRNYVPIGFITKDIISTDANYIVPNASLWDFGILTSIMHNVWMRVTAGKLKSDYRYSARLVYNNFPWPLNTTDKQKQAVENAAQAVLDARVQFPDSSLADLYNPLTMPPALVKAHNALDKAVDACYRPQPFTSDASRMEFLFDLYEKYTADLFTTEKKGKNLKRY